MSVAIGLATHAARGQAPIVTAPYLPFATPEAERYNLKWGPLRARLTGSIQNEFNDNINLAAHGAQADVSFGPELGIGFIWKLGKDQDMHFDTDIGYRWYLKSRSLSSINVAPNSRWKHTIRIGPVQILLADSFSVQVDPTSRPEISGTAGSIVNFRRFNTSPSIVAAWQPMRDLTLSSSYRYSYDRSLTSQFTSIDRDSHSFGSGANYVVSPRWTVGLNGSYGFTEYQQRIQNNGTTYSVGPVFAYKPSHFIMINAAVGYTIATFDHSGTITDQSQSRGVTYEVSLNHTINRVMDQTLTLSQATSDGLGSNFTDILSLQYGLRTRLSSHINLNSTFGYESFQASGLGAERGSRFIVYLGSGYQLSARWNLGVSYAYAWKNSTIPNHDYMQNRFILDLTRQF